MHAPSNLHQSTSKDISEMENQLEINDSLPHFIRRTIAQMAAVFRIAFVSNLAYLGELLGKIFFLSIVLFIFMQLWQVTFSATGGTKLGGFSLTEMLWYLAITEAIVISLPRVSSMVDQDVRTGTLALHLGKPLAYPLLMLSTYFGNRVFAFSLNFAVSSVVAYALAGPLPVSLPGLAIFLVTLPLSFAIDFLAYFLIGLIAFWLEDTQGLVILYNRASMILGGMLIPLELFPDGLRQVLAWLPFSQVVYGPAHLFVHPDSVFLTGILVKQILAIIVYGLAVYAVYTQALKRVFVNGG
jgi:ABC-2 type transport system permease protein